MTTIRQALEENKDNAELLAGLVSEVNSWNGGLDSYEWYDFDEEFFDNYVGENKIDIARAVYFGDIKSWSDEYIRFDGGGNLESASDYTRNEELKENAQEIIDAALENSDNIDLEWVVENYTDYTFDDLSSDEEKSDEKAEETK